MGQIVLISTCLSHFQWLSVNQRDVWLLKKNRSLKITTPFWTSSVLHSEPFSNQLGLCSTLIMAEIYLYILWSFLFYSFSCSNTNTPIQQHHQQKKKNPVKMTNGVCRQGVFHLNNLFFKNYFRSFFYKFQINCHY